MQGTLRLKVEKTHRDGERRVALTRDQWRVRGELRPYIAGQTVLVRFFRDGRKIHQQVEQLQPINGGTAGMFRTPFRAKAEGRVSVQAVHLATPEIDTVRSDKVRVAVLRPSVTNGPIVRLLQKGLAKLRYSTSRSGRYDDATARSVMAWRKVTGAARSFSASESVIRGVLKGARPLQGQVPARRAPCRGRSLAPGAGADRRRQGQADLPHLVGQAVDPDRPRALPRVPQVAGDQLARHGPLELLHRGYAIHGYFDVPSFAASHGCLRVPIPNAWSIYSWVRMDDVVDVYP